MDLLRDFRLALRSFVRRPFLALGIVLTLAIGLGANTAIFTFAIGFFWARFPAPEPERLYWLPVEKHGQVTWGMTFDDSEAYRRSLDGTAELVAESSFSVIMTLPGDGAAADNTAYGFGNAVDMGFFDFFPMRGRVYGRAFTAADYEPGAAAVALLDHGFWQRRFGGDPSILGRPMLLNGRSFTVIGVTPPKYQGGGWVYQLYIPLQRLDDVSSPPLPIRQGDVEDLVAILKLEDDAQRQAAEARIAATSRELDASRPLPHGERRVILRSVLETSGTLKPGHAALVAAVGCLLVLACANVANLLLARAVGRRREIAVHAAMGASPWRVGRYLLIESVLLSLAGGGLGLGVAHVLLGYFERILRTEPLGLGVWGQGTVWLALDGRSIVFTVGLALVTGVLFGLAPILQALRCNMVNDLKSGAKGSGGSGDGKRRFGARQVLVVTQVMLATMLLLGAGLLVTSLGVLLDQDPGYETERQLLAVVAASPPREADAVTRSQVRRDLYELARRQLQDMPGIDAAALVSEAPGSATLRQTRLVLPDHGDAELTVERLQVGPGFFDALDITIRHGRGIDDRDTTGGTGAVVINEAFVARHWPGEDPLGRVLRLPDLGADTESDRFVVVGVAEDIAHFSRLGPPRPAVYLPVAQYLWGTRMTIVARTVTHPASAIPAVRELLHTAHPDLALVEIATYDRQIASDLGDQRLYGLLASLFSSFGLLLACMGIYSVLNVSVSYRRRELGIRMALGARGRDVVRLVIGETFVMVGLGLALGIAGALALGRYLESVLYGVSPYEPGIFAAMPMLLALVAFGAAWLPAQRAGRLDPKAALAEE